MQKKEMRAAAIHDLSGVGKCSLTVVLPVLSACGVETSVMPTAVLSTHTGGFEGFTYRDLTEDMLPMASHWKREGCEFEALYSGFLGSAGQIDIVKSIFSMLQKEDTLVMVDPVMGDNGKLYRTYTREMADGMKRLCQCAHLVVPNMTEASYLLGIPYREGPYEESFIREVLSGLCAMGPELAVLTGVYYDEKELGAACYSGKTGEFCTSLSEKIQGSFHGTGDLFAAALLGGLLNGLTLHAACDLAVNFTHRAIVSTKELSREYRFGPKFELHLPYLMKAMEEERKKLQNNGE